MSLSVSKKEAGEDPFFSFSVSISLGDEYVVPLSFANISFWLEAITFVWCEIGRIVRMLLPPRSFYPEL